LRELVDRRELGGEHAGGAVRRVGDAHADAHLLVLAASHGISGQPCRNSPRELTGNCLGNCGDHPERVLHLPAVRRLRNDDPVEGPDGVEVQLLCKRRQVFEFLDGDLLAEVGQVERELHGLSLPTALSGQVSKLP
jgi:hypothetical protein